MKWLLVPALLLGACVHTQQIDPKEAEHAHQEPETEKPRLVPKQKPKPAPVPNEEGRPRLSPSPAGLLTDGGAMLIQKALVERGYLGAGHFTGTLDELTSGALRKFQGDQEVAKTGSPDRETVRKLGLKIEDVFHSSRDGGT